MLVNTLRILCILLGLTGCGAPRIFQWSPDGNRLLVKSKDTILLVNDDGTTIATHKFSEKVEIYASLWLPDSTSFLIGEAREAQNWAAVDKLLSKQSRRQWVWVARQVKEEILDSRQTRPDLDNTDIPSPTLKLLEGPGSLLVGCYLREVEPKGLDTKSMGEKLGQWFSDSKPIIFSLELYRVAGEEIKHERTLRQGVDPMVAVSVAPNGTFLSVMESTPFVDKELMTLKQEPGPEMFDLWMLPLSGNKPPLLALQNVATDPTQSGCDWSQDSQRVAVSNGFEQGRIWQIEVADSAGNLLAEPKADELATTAKAEFPVHFLPDGRLLFAAAKSEYPRPARFTSEQYRFYVSTTTSPIEVHPLPQKDDSFAISAALEKGAYALSPDRKKVAIAAEDGRVWIQDLMTGESQLVQPINNKPKDSWERSPSYAMPSWRNNYELSFAVPAKSEHGSPNRPEVILWSDKKVLCVSKKWPDEILSPPKQ